MTLQWCFVFIISLLKVFLGLGQNLQRSETPKVKTVRTPTQTVRILSKSPKPPNTQMVRNPKIKNGQNPQMRKRSGRPPDSQNPHTHGQKTHTTVRNPTQTVTIPKCENGQNPYTNGQNSHSNGQNLYIHKRSKLPQKHSETPNLKTVRNPTRAVRSSTQAISISTQKIRIFKCENGQKPYTNGQNSRTNGQKRQTEK